jgi:hypothetical protein
VIDRESVAVGVLVVTCRCLLTHDLHPTALEILNVAWTVIYLFREREKSVCVCVCREGGGCVERKREWRTLPLNPFLYLTPNEKYIYSVSKGL